MTKPAYEGQPGADRTHHPLIGEPHGASKYLRQGNVMGVMGAETKSRGQCQRRSVQAGIFDQFDRVWRKLFRIS